LEEWKSGSRDEPLSPLNFDRKLVLVCLTTPHYLIVKVKDDLNTLSPFVTPKKLFLTSNLSKLTVKT